MMDDKIPTPNDPTPMGELSDTLRPAVEQVRVVVPPAEAVERSLDRAERLGPPRRRRSRRWLAYSAAASIAATILVGFMLWSGQPRKPSEQVALNQSSPDLSNDASGDVKNLATLTEAWSSTPTNKTSKPRKDGTSNIFPAGNTYTKDHNVQFDPISSKALNPLDDNGRERLNQDNKKLDFSFPLSQASAVKGSSTIHTRPAMPARLPGAPGMPASGSGESAPGTGRHASGAGMPAGPGMGGMSMMGMGGMGMMGMSGANGTPWMMNPYAGYLYSAAIDGTPSADTANLKLLKQQIAKQELVLNKTDISKTSADEARKNLRDAKAQVKVLEERIAEGKSQANAKQPQVWHRDRSRPAFARVYVGNGNALELVSLNVSVTIEGPRARTVVDHIFRNPHDRQLEGTFEYPLPSGASPSYFAMFLGQTRDTVPARFHPPGDVPLPATALARLTPAELVKHVDTTDWGRLQEARIVSKEKALETYEEVVRGRIDPALLEYAGGNTFSGRVFPIPAKGYNRVILAYEELLPCTQDHMLYRFPLPGRKLNEVQFSLQANAAECRQPTFLPKDADKEENGSRITFSRRWKDAAPEGEIVFACTPADPQVQAVSGRQGDNGPRYVYARLRPSLKTVAKDRAFASHAVFLLDTSLSEHPERFAVNMKLLQKILEGDPDIKHFNVLTFNVGAAWLDNKDFFDNTAAGREKALKKLDGIVLEGATDISCALDKLAAPGFDLAAGTNLNVFLLSDGHITWGEPDVATLAARFEQRCRYATRFHCYRTGLGEENSELFEALTRNGGGIFQCFGEADLKAAAQAHRSQCMKVRQVRFVGGPEASDILVSGRRAAIYPGGELVVTARFNGTGRTTVVVEGEFAGQKMVQEFPLEVRSASELAPRAWAEVAVASLLALHDGNLDNLVTAYCQQFGIVSRVASFLVLENEADYKRFNLEEERGRTVAGDLSVFLADVWARLGKGVPAGKDFERFLNQVNKRVKLLDGPNGAHVRQILTLLKEADFELPASTVRGALVHRKDVADYVNERERDRRNVGVYLKEARRRAEASDVDGAVRVLSSVIEEHPGRGDALRLVGYRLLDLGQAGQAARLFGQVQRQRPFEPHSYRDFAHALEQSGKYGLAAVNYEIVLAGTWHNRFRQELKTVAMEEYAHMMQESIRRKAVSLSLANVFGERLEQMTRPQPKSDLRVTIAWNTDATDIDLWVIEPDGAKCFYSHNRTQSGGELSQDQTQGYGPERYQIAKAQPGVYTVIVHYYRPNPNLLGGETHVTATVTRFAGTAQEKTERHTVILKQHNEQVEVCKVKF
jgi:hypothetical protein